MKLCSRGLATFLTYFSGLVRNVTDGCPVSRNGGKAEVVQPQLGVLNAIISLLGVS